ncbi:hypothetical protein ACFVYR_01290 [Streptomyces sp. NPDC058284]|uniref:hypothetical protein n=1 Tax=unclassified Streptomyces TaxID=2593676 RepID=UPI00365FE501
MQKRLEDVVRKAAVDDGTDFVDVYDHTGSNAASDGANRGIGDLLRPDRDAHESRRRPRQAANGGALFAAATSLVRLRGTAAGTGAWASANQTPWDGRRCQIDTPTGRVWSHHGTDFCSAFADVARAARALPDDVPALGDTDIRPLGQGAAEVRSRDGAAAGPAAGRRSRWSPTNPRRHS